MSVAYTIVSTKKRDDGRFEVVADIAYSSEAYSSGVAVDKGQLGLPTVLESLVFVDAEDNTTRQFKFNPASEKIRAYAETASDYAEVSGTLTATLRVQAVGY